MSVRAGAAVRDPLADHLLTPQNAALAVIDYQPPQFSAVRSMDPDLLLRNIASTVKLPKLFRVPVVHSTINVAGGAGPTVPELAGLAAGDFSTEVGFAVEGDAIRIVKTSPSTHGHALVERLRGSGHGRMSTDEILALTRK